MKNKIIKALIKKVYTDKNGKLILTEEEINNELLIDKAIYSVSQKTCNDEQLLKLRFLKNNKFYQERMDNDVNLG
jgi:hypothetical protein